MSQSDVISELRKRIETAREKFKSADENIKKHVNNSFNSPRTPGRLNEISGRGFPMKRNLSDTPSGPHAKRANFSQITFNEKANISNNENMPDEDTRTVVSSSVVRVEKTRKDAIQDMKHTENPGDKQRGRRMFGMLLTTLAKFKDEADDKAVAKQDKALQKIEEKIAESKKEEEEVMKKEKEELIGEKKAAEAEIRLLHEQLKLTEIFETWKNEVERTRNYIRTDTKPFVFYRPKTPSSESDKRLTASCKKINDMIAAKKASLDADLAKLTEESKSRLASTWTSAVKSTISKKKDRLETGNISSSSSRAPSPNLNQSDHEKAQPIKSAVVVSSKLDDDNESEISEGQDDIVLESADPVFNDNSNVEKNKASETVSNDDQPSES